jgi:hypothetical protein
VLAVGLPCLGFPPLSLGGCVECVEVMVESEISSTPGHSPVAASTTVFPLTMTPPPFPTLSSPRLSPLKSKLQRLTLSQLPREVRVFVGGGRRGECSTCQFDDRCHP